MSQRIITTLLGYGAVHGIVDFSCAALLFAVMRLQGYSAAGALGIFVLYNACAFGLQFLLGMIVDRYRMPKESAFLGVAWILFACFFTDYFALVALISGIGNALFHVGAGSISLTVAPGKAAPVGLFTAPGFVGLTVGTLFGQSDSAYHFAVIVGVLLVSLVFLFFAPVIHGDATRRTPNTFTKSIYVAIFCVLLAVSVRALYGFHVTFPWMDNGALFALFVGAVACGKACGGFIADRWGWCTVSMLALGCAILLLPFFGHVPVLIFVGVWCFHVATPVIFALLGRLFPGRSAFAFGIVETAFACGALPLLFGVPIASGTGMTLGLVAGSAVILLTGMKIMYNDGTDTMSA